MSATLIVFTLGLVTTFLIALFGRLVSANDTKDSDLAGRSLNRWLIGFSAGATGNSGFIVTGAVGLGYTGGAQWLMLPLAWLLGDLVFWKLFPNRINRVARDTHSATIPQLISSSLSGPLVPVLRGVTALTLVSFLAIYTASQWIAGDKFLSAAFDLSSQNAVLLFSGSIVAYSVLGGFRGSVYVDTFQAVLSLLGATLAFGTVLAFALGDHAQFATNISEAGSNFLIPFSGVGIISIVGFFVGYAAASMGFGLGQPQVTSRYFAGASPEETKAAKWIYIGFLQYTWIMMTLFGMLLRGVMPEIDDPEAGLSVFFESHFGGVLAGLVFVYVYAIIASTANSLIVASSQLVARDALPKHFRSTTTPFYIIGSFGLVTIGLSFVLPGNVFTIAISAVSMIGAALAGPMIIKLYDLPHTAVSLIASILSGVASAYLWADNGYNAFVNEAAVGLLVGLFVNFAFIQIMKNRA